MSNKWKRYLDRILQEGEMFGLVFTTLMLIVVEGCFVYGLHRIQLPDRQFAASGFLVVPPWYREPRFEVTLLLTIAAGKHKFKTEFDEEARKAMFKHMDVQVA